MCNQNTRAKKIVATGHSLGGAKALYSGRKYGIEAVAFNPGPLGSKNKPCEQCTVVRTKHDLISTESKSYTDVEVEAKEGNYFKKVLTAHSMFPWARRSTRTCTLFVPSTFTNGVDRLCYVLSTR